MNNVRDDVSEFARAMELKLQEHDDERGETGWERETVSWLFDRLKEEVNEAEGALTDCRPRRLAKECVDVANFAMMIHRIIRAREDSS